MKWIFIISFLGLGVQPSHGLQTLFVFFQTPKTWIEAQSICRQQGCDLATINSMSEMETVLEVVKDKYTGSVWFGLQRGSTPTWHWSLAGKEFYKEGEDSYLIWSAVNNQFNCGTYRDGKLQKTSCINLFYSVCFDETKQGADQYILVTQSLAWIDARDYCRTNYTDLTSLRNDAEYQMVQEAANGSEVWVGLYRDTWQWSDQTNSSFRYWKPTYPVWNNIYNCSGLVKTYSGRWDEVSCETAHRFICGCNGKKMRIIKLRISPQDSKTDLENPLMQENILEQVKQWLGNNSVIDDIQLKWAEQANGRVFIKEP